MNFVRKFENNFIMKNIPNKIFIQVGENPSSDDFKELDEEEITWSTGKCFDNDIEYCRFTFELLSFSSFVELHGDENIAGDRYASLPEMSKIVINSAIVNYLSYLFNLK